MKQIEYEVKDNLHCLTRCPFKMKDADILYIWNVASNNCITKCGWFESIDEEKQIVRCNHPEGRR